MFNPDLYFHDNTPWFYPDHISFTKKIEIYLNTVTIKDSTLPKVLCIISEPKFIRPLAENEDVIASQYKFNIILTHDADILANCSNSIFMPYGTTWINKEDQHGNMEKVFGTSFLCGLKAMLYGHLMRHEIWKRQNEFTTPIVFWNSSSQPMPDADLNPILGYNFGEKLKLMKQQFHICVENCRLINYFTEKIIDCFITKTIPVYCGCPNIDNFFNVKGMILFDSVNELITKVNSFTPDTYKKMKPFIIENYKLSQQYCEPIAKRIEKSISKNMQRI